MGLHATLLDEGEVNDQSHVTGCDCYPEIHGVGKHTGHL